MKNKLIWLVMVYNKNEARVMPFALMYISSALKKHGFLVKITHCSNQKIKETCEEIIQAQPLFVGLSVLTGDITKASVELSQLIKSGSDIPVVWGGVHPSLLPKQCLSENYIDFVVIGEGEETIVDFVYELQKKNPDFSKIKGLGYVQNQKITINPPRPFIKKLDEYHLDFECINIKKYISTRTSLKNEKKQKIRSIGYYSSRGCPFNCMFCYNQVMHQRVWRGHSVEYVVRHINFLKQSHNINEVIFWDDNFLANKQRALKILKKIGISAGLEMRADVIDETLLAQLKQLQVNYLLIGGESGSDRILKLINKGIDTQTFLEKVVLLNKHNIPVQYSFILGIPTESAHEFNQTLDFMLKILKIHKKASFTVGMFMPYPGTGLFELARQCGFEEPKSTKKWCSLDRWKNLVLLPWINNRTCLIVRQIFALMPISNKLIKRWLYFRVRHKIFRLSIDLKLLVCLNSLKNRCSFILKNARLI